MTETWASRSLPFRPAACAAKRRVREEERECAADVFVEVGWQRKGWLRDHRNAPTKTLHSQLRADGGPPDGARTNAIVDAKARSRR